MRLRHVLSGLSRTALVATGVAAGASILVTSFAVPNSARAATTDLVLTGPGEGGGAHIRTFSPTGTASDVGFFSAGSSSSGATVATADVNGDGTPEIITGTGAGPRAQVQVWSKDGKTLLASATPFGGFSGGVTVAAANLDDDAAAEIIVGAGPGGGPHVKAYNFTSNQLVEAFGFYAYDKGFHGGVFVAGAPGAIVTGAGAGGGPHVRVWSVVGGVPSVTAEWMAYGAFGGGVRVATGAVQGNDIEVVTGAGPGGGPHVKLFGLDGVEGAGTMAYDPAFGGGVYVAVANGKRLITGAGAGGGPHVKIWTVNNDAFTTTASFYAYSPDFAGGVRVAGFPATTSGSGTTTTTGAGGSTTSTTGGATTTTAACNGIPPVCL